MQVEHIALTVAQHLHLDMLGARDILLEKDRGIAKGPLRFALRFIEQGIEIACLVHHAHATPASAESRLDDQRKSNIRRDLQGHAPVAHRVLRAGQSRNLQLLRQRARRHLVTHEFEQVRLRADELDARRPARAGEIRILREEPVARMNEVHAMLLGNGHDPLDIEIRTDRPLAFAHEIRFVRLEAVHRKAVLLRIDRHRAQPQFGRRTKDADGDFGTIGDEEFLLAGRRGGRRRAGRRHGKRGVSL